MKINILTTGRFHVLDLAIELERLGHEVNFYSYVPTKRARSFGLSRKASKSILLVMVPFLALHKLMPKSIFVENLKINFQDWFTSIYMKKCDVVIAMSGLYIKALYTAKKNNCVIIVERGSKHILEQKRILESIRSLEGTNPVPDAHVARELESYELSDYISIPSIHAKESFLEHHFSEQKLFVNSYGVDLKMFAHSNAIPKKYDVIYVGNWSYQKGCDILTEAVLEMNLELLHVGAIFEIDFPRHRNFTHVDAVDQSKLQDFYNQAKVFVLASRQDGFGMVLCQALSCQLPIVAAKNTGGLDLKKMDISFEDWVYVSSLDTSESLKTQIKQALDFASKEKNAIPNLEVLTWRAYGQRYDKFLKNIHPNFQK